MLFDPYYVLYYTGFAFGRPSDRSRSSSVRMRRERWWSRASNGTSGPGRVRRAYFDEHDLWPHWRHHTGHAIGLRYHEGPFLDSGDHTEIRPGMVFTVEPGLYSPELGGFRHSDTVLVTDDGIEILTYYPRDLASLIIPGASGGTLRRRERRREADMDAAVTTELRTIGHWIGGESIRGESGRKGPVYNPATGEQTGEVDFASTEEIDRAVAAATAAHSTWRHWSLSKRAELFFRIYQLLDEHREDLARLLTAEHGKVLSDALGEVQRGIEVIEYVCGIPELLKGDYSEQASTGIDVYSIRQPLGVVAGHHAVQLPRDGAHVDVGARDRLREHVHPQAVGEGPVRVDPHRRAAQGGRASGRRLQRRAGRQGRGRRDPRSTPASLRSPSSARRRSRATSTRPGRRRASACRRSAARRTT